MVSISDQTPLDSRDRGNDQFNGIRRAPQGKTHRWPNNLLWLVSWCICSHLAVYLPAAGAWKMSWTLVTLNTLLNIIRTFQARFHSATGPHQELLLSLQQYPNHACSGFNEKNTNISYYLTHNNGQCFFAGVFMASLILTFILYV